MTPSGITEGQAAKVEELLAAGLRKSGLPREAVQSVLKTQGPQMVAELVAVVRKFVEVVSKFIVRIIMDIDRTLTPQQILNNTGRRQYVNSDVVATMPRGEGKSKEIIWFPLGEYKPSTDAVMAEYDRLGLKPVDPYSLAKANTDGAVFADTRPNATIWKDTEGNWCFLAFRRWIDGVRSVDVNRYDDVWYVGWWFAGVRK